MLTGALVTEFLEAKKAKRLSPRTIEKYEWALGRFGETFPELPTEPEAIEGYSLQFSEAATLDTHWRSIATLYHWAVKRRKLGPEDNPMLYAERPVMQSKPARAFSIEEVQTIFAYPHSGYMRLLLRLLIRTGLRLGEAMSLEPSNECLRENTIIVHGKTGVREVPCDPELITVLRWMLPWPWKDARVASHRVIKAIRAAGLSGKRASAHTLRHSFARLYEGDSENLSGIMWGGPSKMLGRYRPYDVNRALKEYRRQSWIA